MNLRAVRWLMAVAMLTSPLVAAPQQSIAPLSVAAPARIGRTHLRLQRSGDDIVLRDDANVLGSRPVFATSDVVIEGTAGDDTLVVDFTNGNPIPPGGITFNGGAEVTRQGDVLEIVGGNFQEVEYNYTNAHDGSIDLDGSVIRYTGLEPLSNSGTVADAVFTFPASSQPILEDDGTSGNGTVQVRSGNGSFETTTFSVPTNSLTVNSGGSDTITVAAGFSGDFNVGLTINGNASTDVVTLNALNLNSGSTSLAVTAKTINLNGNVSSGDTVFTGTLDGASSLATVRLTLNGAVGATTPLTSIQGGIVVRLNGGSITTTGAQTYAGSDTILGANTTLTSTGAGNIKAFSVYGAFSLAVNTAGLTEIRDIGLITPLASITTDAAGSTLIHPGSGITTTGPQTYNDALVLGTGNTTETLTSTGGGDITFGSTVNGIAANARSLIVNTSGTTTFGGAVGGTFALISVTTDAGGVTAINGGSITTTGAQTFSDAVTLGNNATLTSTGSGTIAFGSTLDGAGGLTANTAGTTTFGGAVGATTPLATLTTDAAGSTTVSGNVTTSAAQAFNDAVTLGANSAFGNSSGNITFAKTIDGAFLIGVGAVGAATFAGAIGGTTPLTSFSALAGGGIALNGGSITDTGVITLNSPVTLGANTTLTSSAALQVKLNAVDGAFALTVNTPGQTMFAGPVGATTPLTSVTTDAPGTTRFNGGSATTTGAQTYNDPVTLGSNATFGSSGSITFPGTIAGAFALGKSGTGTMALSTTNTYAGGTTVSAGTLLDTAVAGTGAGNVTVAAGATLGGTGTIPGSVTLQNNAIVAPGTSIGTLTIGGGVTWTGSNTGATTANFELSNSNTTCDQLVITGTLTKGAGPTFKFDFQGTGHIATYTLATFASTSFTAGDFSFTNLPPGFDAQFVVNPTSLQLVVISSAATHFMVSTPATATAGSAFNFTVTALDAFNDVDTAYSGTVHFTSSDGQATLPANSTLTGGVGTFSATLKTASNQTITATDTVTSMTGTSGTTVVSPAAATHFTISAPASATAGSAFNFTVTALDAFNNTATGYAGIVHFTSTDGAATLPANSTLTNGTGTFSATLRTAGNQTITGQDTGTPSVTGTSNTIVVSFATLDLSITNTPSPAPYGTGLPITYTIVVKNSGPADGTAVTVTDVLPTGTTLTSATPTQGTCSGTTTVTCNLGTLINGASATISLTIHLPSTPGTVSDTATVSSSNPDSNPANDSATASVNVIQAAGIPTLSPLMLLLLAAAAGLIAVMRLRS